MDSYFELILIINVTQVIVSNGLKTNAPRSPLMKSYMGFI